MIWFRAAPALPAARDRHGAVHVRVEAAEIRERTRLGRDETPARVGGEATRVPRVVSRADRVRHQVPVAPLDGVPRRQRHERRIERDPPDRDHVQGVAAGGGSVAASRSERCHRDEDHEPRRRDGPTGAHPRAGPPAAARGRPDGPALLADGPQPFSAARVSLALSRWATNAGRTLVSRSLSSAFFAPGTSCWSSMSSTAWW